MSPQNEDIDRLISLYLSNRASEKEKAQLDGWLQASPENRKVFDRLRQMWTLSATHEYRADMDQVRDAIWLAGTAQKQSMKQPGRKPDVIYWIKIAATFLIFFFGAWLLLYLIQSGTFSEEIVWVEEVNPSGQRSTHRLPDGTKVWLNSESSLSYPENFSDTLRQVYLKGEAFFEVVSVADRPFVVEAGGVDTRVLGTSFNINDYPSDLVRIALLEGKVQVQDTGRIQTAFLSPGQELIARKDGSGFSIQPFNYEQTFGWKEGILIFDGVDFNSFRASIEKWYGVKVAIQGSPPNDWHIRARYQNENLRNVLRDVCFNKNIEFELHDKNVTIIF